MDIKTYHKIYEDLKDLTPDDTLKLVLESETEEEKEFWELVGDYLLQKKQKEVINNNLF